jgi:acetyl esterase/lipase
MGWIGWIAVTAVVLGAALLAGWRYAHASGAVGLLDWADARVEGQAGVLPPVTARYGTSPAQRLIVIAPDRPGPHPVLVFFHGGSWKTGQPEDYGFVGRRFARAGYVVVLPAYRLGAEGTYPAMLEDGAAALGWVNGQIAQHGGDPERVFLMGHSAGGYITAMLALERQWLGRAGLPDGFIKGMVGLSGPYDFYPFTSDSARDAFGHVADPAVTQPIHYVRRDAPPMLLVTGDADTTVKPRNSRVLTRALRDAGVRVELLELPEVDHAGTVKPLAWPFASDRRIEQAALAFMGELAAAPSAPIQAAAE